MPYEMLILILSCLGSSFVVSVIATALVRRYAPRWGLMDQPAARKVHVTPTPLGGGIGIWCGVIVPLLVVHILAWLVVDRGMFASWCDASMRGHLQGVLQRGHLVWSIIAGGTVLSTMGLLDDLKNLPWQPRLLIQMLISAGLIYAGVRATLSSGSWPPWSAGRMKSPT